MNYGMNLAASGVLTNLYRMDVLANNLANSGTPGFKAISPGTRERDVARVEDGLAFLPSNTALERLGAGAMLMGHRVSHAQGGVEKTDRPLDVAIEGRGFLVVQTGEGVDSEALRLTRDGRLTRNARGELVQASTGLPVLDTANKPITLTGDGPVRINRDGTISQGAGVVARLQLASVASPERLRPLGNGLFQGDNRLIASRKAADATLTQGAVESSSVDAVKTMMDITSAERAVGANLRMITLYDQLMERAVSLGRVA
ncbi:MAG: flagellar hook-basal body protein [Phycisphaerales bacterium]